MQENVVMKESRFLRRFQTHLQHKPIWKSFRVSVNTNSANHSKSQLTIAHTVNSA